MNEKNWEKHLHPADKNLLALLRSKPNSMNAKTKALQKAMGEKGKNRVKELGFKAAQKASRGRNPEREDRALGHIFNNRPKEYGEAYKQLYKEVPR